MTSAPWHSAPELRDRFHPDHHDDLRVCDRCGADQTLDPPTSMARTRFPDAPAGSAPLAFSALCPCGGTMLLALVEGIAAPR